MVCPPLLRLLSLLSVIGSAHSLILPSAVRQIGALGQAANRAMTKGIAPVPSPFALANFAPSAFSPNMHGASTLTLTWKADVEDAVNDLIRNTLTGTAGEAVAELTVVSRARVAGSVRLVLLGARSAQEQFLQMAAMRNIVPEVA